MDNGPLNNQSNNNNSDQQGTEIAAFVLGITSLVLSLSLFSGGQFIIKLILGATCAIVGLILGIAVNKVEKTKMGTTAIVTSIISLSIYLLSMFACSACAVVGCSYIGALCQ